jgi:hypothetical protein
MSKLRQIARLVSPRLAGSLNCEACGKEFSCGASLQGCWCSEIELSNEVRTELKTKYRDCLCRDCLELLSESRPVGIAGG